jgi:hypothetical protein
MDRMTAGDSVTALLERARDGGELLSASGLVLVEWAHADGEVYASELVKNLITSVGDAGYVSRGAGIGTPPAAPTGIRLGTGTTAVAKTGAGAALVTYLAGSNRAFDATFPSVAGNVATYKATWAAGVATTASAITEAALVNDTIATDATTAAANTWARILLATPAAKAATDSLTLTWTNTITGA